MSIHVIAPDGKTHGPFRDRWEAQRFGNEKFPDKICGNREEDADAWEIQISTRDQP